ncbi:MAG: sulfate adenylyltransferase subunit CysN [Opitutales bacterium]|nr:sulfate adenylyltransferase subunit CysN [Opitutales bacterium]
MSDNQNYKVREQDLIKTDIGAYLKRHEEKDMLRFLTCGSVDDGKSTLIGRLLYDSQMIYEDQLAAVMKDSKVHGTTDEEFDPALLTDGLKAEREQGITIDVAYRYFSTERRSFIICDSPGHEQYTRNMATGASHCDLAIVLIDARHGVMAQTKRHSFIASLLGIKHLVVAVNKMDAVDYSEEVYEQIRKDYVAFAAKFENINIHFIPMSALKGDNVVERSENMDWFDGRPLLSYLENVEVAADRNLIDFRFPVQYVLRPNLNFRGFAGTIVSGVVRVGDAISVNPSGKTTKVKEIVTYDGKIDEAFAPMAVTLTTEDEVDISRGDILSHPNNRPHTESGFDAQVVWMNEVSLKSGKNYLMKAGTQTVPVTLDGVRYKFDINNLNREDTDTLEMNEIGRIGFTAHRAFSFDTYSRIQKTGSFILIDQLSNATVAAGMIIEQRAQEKKEVSGEHNINWEKGMVSQEERETLMGHKASTIWLTGLSGSGKSTIAQILESKLVAAGKKAYILDGDNIRHGLNRDLGFKPEDRKENIRRIAEVAALLNDAGIIVITAFISPYQEDRDMARSIVNRRLEDSSGSVFHEIHVDTPIEVCEARDVKGLYAKARKGEIQNFTGITAPYEVPESPELSVSTESATPASCADLIIEKLGL